MWPGAPPQYRRHHQKSSTWKPLHAPGRFGVYIDTSGIDQGSLTSDTTAITVSRLGLFRDSRNSRTVRSDAANVGCSLEPAWALNQRRAHT